jgi:hypothetical protein
MSDNLVPFPGVPDVAPTGFVHIQWIDSGLFHENGWETVEEIVPVTGLSTVDTVGIMFHEDDESYRVALSVDFAHGHYFGVQTIAKNCVVSVRNV